MNMNRAVWCYLLRQVAGVTEVCLAPKLKRVGSRNYVSGLLNVAGGHHQPPRSDAARHRTLLLPQARKTRPVLPRLHYPDLD